jgi:nucleoid-associated protein YgaU
VALAAASLATAAGGDGGSALRLTDERERDAADETRPLHGVEQSRRAFQRLMRRLAERSERFIGPRPKRREPDWEPARPARPTPARWEDEDDDERPPPPRDRETGPSHESCWRAGVVVEGAGWYVVRQGDTLWTIAAAHYGNGRAWRRILDANWRKIKDPSCIYACQRLYIPRWGHEWPDEEEKPWTEPAAPPRRIEPVKSGGCSDCGAGSHESRRAGGGHDDSEWR